MQVCAIRKKRGNAGDDNQKQNLIIMQKQLVIILYIFLKQMICRNCLTNCCLLRSESDGELVIGLSSWDAAMDRIPFKGWSPRSMDYRRSRVYSTRARRGIGGQSMDNTSVQWIWGRPKSFFNLFKIWVVASTLDNGNSQRPPVSRFFLVSLKARILVSAGGQLEWITSSRGFFEIC